MNPPLGLPPLDGDHIPRKIPVGYHNPPPPQLPSWWLGGGGEDVFGPPLPLPIRAEPAVAVEDHPQDRELQVPPESSDHHRPRALPRLDLMPGCRGTGGGGVAPDDYHIFGWFGPRAWIFPPNPLDGPVGASDELAASGSQPPGTQSAGCPVVPLWGGPPRRGRGRGERALCPPRPSGPPALPTTGGATPRHSGRPDLSSFTPRSPPLAPSEDPPLRA